MAKKKGVSAEFKAANFNSSVKVSSSTINDLRAGKTFEGNVAKFKSGGTAQQMEAMNRFYGKARVSKALGSSITGSSVSAINKTYGTSPGSSYKGAGTSGYKAPKAATPAGLTKTGASVGNFVKNELLGVDDFSKLGGQMKNKQYMDMAQSAGTGAFELGTTAAAVIGSIFTGGAAGGALIAAKTAQVAARQGAKVVIQQGAKATATSSAKTIGKSAVKVATGNPLKAVIKVPKAVGKGLVKSPGKAKNVYKARGTVTPTITAAKNTAKATKTASDTASEVYNVSKIAAGGKAAKGLGASYDAARAATLTASKAHNAAKKLKITQAKKLAKGKKVRAGARNAILAHGVGKALSTPTKKEKK